jgi:hypothetical protein
MATWEQVASDTYRLPVPGGWLYTLGRDTLVFVPALDVASEEPVI